MNRANVIGPSRRDLVADRRRRRTGSDGASRSGPRRLAPQVHRPAPRRARAGAPARRGCGRRGRPGSGRRGPTAVSARSHGSAIRVGEEEVAREPVLGAPASPPRPRRSGGRAARGCRPARRRRARPGSPPSAAGPVAVEEQARGSSAAGRWPGRPRPEPALLDERPRPRRGRSLEPGEAVAADVRPATTSSRPRIATRRPRRRRARPDRAASSRSPPGRAAASPAPTSRRRRAASRGRRRSRQRRRRSLDLVARRPRRASAAGALSVARSGRLGELVGAGDRDDVGRVPVVRERAGPPAPRRRRRTPRDRPRSPAGSRPSRGRRARPGRRPATSSPDARPERYTVGAARRRSGTSARPRRRSPRRCRSAFVAPDRRDGPRRAARRPAPARGWRMTDGDAGTPRV